MASSSYCRVTSKVKIRTKLGNSIEDARIRTMRIFAVIALVSSFFVFFAFSIRLVWQEEAQIENHLRSFKGVAEQLYALSPAQHLKLSEYMTVYYGEEDLPQSLKALMPIPLNTIDRYSFKVRISKDQVLVPGAIVYHFVFQHQGKNIPAYITMSSFEMDLWGDSWGVLMLISTFLMLFLIIVLRITLKRVFDQLMTPISNLSDQLRNSHAKGFTVPEDAVDELQQLTSHLNSYSEMKDRLAKQELMFAKYASHELKTPIAIVQGAAELQAMKPMDSEFQAKQRDRILKAARGMKATVEVLLNIVKQENAATDVTVTELDALSIDLSKYEEQLTPGVELSLDVAPGTRLNMPLTLVNMVLKNYIENAIRFTQQGQIVVTIDSNEISVSDTGVGLHSHSKTEHGLGLIIVKRIGESYGWTSTLINKSDDSASQDESGCRAVFSRNDVTKNSVG